MAKGKRLANGDIVQLLRSVAAVYGLKGDKFRFQSIAYQRAADAVEHATSELFSLWEDGRLEDVPGVGPAIAKHLSDVFSSGRSKHFDSLLGQYPEATFELMRVPGVGAKTAFKIAKVLGISKRHGAIEKLEEAAKKGRIRKIEGFGEESESRILKAIEDIKSREVRMLLPYAAGVADGVLRWMRENAKVLQAEPLGSLRRCVATVGDIDVAVSTKDPEAVIGHFLKYPRKVRVLDKGEVTASIMLGSETQVDLYTQPPESFGSLLQHLTGSKHHNIALRTYAAKMGFSLSEYGVVKLRSGEKVNPEAEVKAVHNQTGIRKFESEEGFYNFLKMRWIPPELREDKGEIKAALEDRLPHLVELSDIRGDLQIHSDFPIEPSHDVGADTMEDILREAEHLGYEYVAFTEHNPSLSKHTDRQIVDLLKRKRETVEQLSYSREKKNKLRVIKVFNSLEVDIRPDGSLSLPEQGLELLDFILVSIHSSFEMGREEMTKRILRALEHPKAKIFAHPSARLLNERSEIEVNWEELFEFCLKRDKWLEIDAEPSRLDLPEALVFEAVKRGVKMSMGTDSHAKSSLTNIKYGVSVARRGWAEKKDVVNTLPTSELLRKLALS